MATNTQCHSNLYQFVSIDLYQFLKQRILVHFFATFFPRTEFSSFHMRISSVIVPQKSRNDRYRFSPTSQTCQKTLDCFHMNCSCQFCRHYNFQVPNNSFSSSSSQF